MLATRVELAATFATRTATARYRSTGSTGIEIINLGGTYGDVTPETFGQPGLLAYRNPNLAEAMRVTRVVQRYGIGIPLVRRELRAKPATIAGL